MPTRDHILLFVESKADRRLLRQFLASRSQVTDGTAEPDLDGAFDLVVTDAAWLQRLAPRIVSRRQEEQPLFLPFLLVCNPRERTQAVEYLGSCVEDVAYVPIRKAELQARIEGLLHTRALSLESRRNYFELVDASPVAALLLQDDMVVYANPAFVALAGIRPSAEAIGAPLLDFIHSADRERVKQHCETALRSGRVGACAELAEARIASPSGSRWVELRTSPIRFRSRPALLALLRDKTERKGLELIHEATVGKRGSFDEICRRLALVIAHESGLQHVGICMRNGTGLRVMAQAANGELTETPEASFTQGLCKSVFETGEPHVGALDPGKSGPAPACLTSGRLLSFLVVPVKTDADEVAGAMCAAASSRQAFGQDDVSLFETLAEHLGRQSEIDTLRQGRARTSRMELLGQLTSGVAHEVRNPINAILATAEALDLDIGEDAEHGESIRQIRLQVERVALLMRDLLDLGKPIPEANRTVCRLADVCTGAVSLWQKTTTLRNCSVRAVPGAVGGAATVFVDPGKMHQVICNLLDNAAQHSPEGNEIRLILPPSSESVAGFLVVDGGVGVPTEDLPHLFEPFYTKRKKGTGLGLSIVKHIVENHGGTVSIRNNDPPPGCTVEVALPVVAAQA